jgi:hypothetical protein
MLFYIILFVAILFGIWRMWRGPSNAHVETRDPAFDRTEGHPHTAEAFDRLIKADWTAVSALYWRLPPSDRYHLVQGLGELAAMESITWPEDADSAILTIGGGLRLAQAWKFRGSGSGASVSRTDASRMMTSLAEAGKLLERAAVINPHDSTNLALQIRTETGLSGDQAALNNLLGRIEASGEHNIFAAANHLQFISPKWHGSVEQMWKVANGYASNPRNAAWVAIAARAHIEEWLHAMNFDASMRQTYIARLQDEGFAEHIRSLDRVFWNRVRDAPMTSAEATFAHNNFAFLLQMARIDDLMAAHLKEIGPRISALPWGYLPGGAERPMRLLTDLRRKAGLGELANAGVRSS